MSYKNPRLGPYMSSSEAIPLFADRNEDALDILEEMGAAVQRIDPQCHHGALGPLMSLDVLDIYGFAICVFYESVCGSDIRRFITLLRAEQLGFLQDSELKLLVRKRVTVPDDLYEEILADVKKELVNFNPDAI